MKVQIVFLVLCLVLFRTQADTVQPITIVIDDAYKPFSYAENGQPKGLYVDILQAVSRNMPQFEIELKALPWERGKMHMKNGKELGLAPVYFHGHDWPYLYPYSIPLHREEVEVICHSDTKNLTNRKWPQEYAGLSVGNMRGYDGWGGLEFHQLVAERKISYQEMSSAEQLILMTLKRRLDCMLMEEFVYAWHLKNLIKSKQISEAEVQQLHAVQVVGSDYAYIGYSEIAIQSGNFPNQYRFRRALDSTLYKMHKSGELAKVIDLSKRRYAGTPLSSSSE